MRALALAALAACAALAGWACAAQPLGPPTVLNPDLGGLQALPDGSLLAWGSDASLWRQDAGGPWVAAATPHTGRIRGVALADEAGEAPVLVAVGDGGLLLRSLDGGRSWQGRPASEGRALAAVACRARVCLAAGAEAGLLHSADAGASWQALQAGPAGALTTVSASGPGWWVGTAEGQVWHAPDAGSAWQAMPLPQAAPVDALAADGGGVLLATTDGRLWAASRPGAAWRTVHRSTAGAFTRLARLTPAGAWVATGSHGACAWRAQANAAWRRCNLPARRLVRGLASDPGGKQWAAVGEAGLLMHSADQGRHWQPARVAGLDAPRGLESVAWSAAARSFVAVGAGGLVLRGDASGRRWTAEHQSPAHYVHDLAQAANGDLVASLSQRTLARSTDGGLRWRSRQFAGLQEPAFLFALHADPRRGSLVAAGGQGSVMVAADGRHWRLESQGHGVDYLGLLADPETSLVLLYGTGGRVLRVDSAQARWQQQPLPSEDPVYGGVAVPGGPLVLLGGQGLVMVGSDSGRQWQPQRLGDAALHVGLVTPDGRALLVAGDRGALFRAALGARGELGDWQRIATPAADWRVLQADASGQALWLAGSGGHFARSTDGGMTWQPIAVPSASSLRRPVRDAARRCWWMPGRDGTLLRSDDDGLSWQRVFTQTTEHFKGVWVDPRSGDVLLYGARLVRLKAGGAS